MTMSANGGGAPIGWYSVGTGKQMDGSNMMVSRKHSSVVRCSSARTLDMPRLQRNVVLIHPFVSLHIYHSSAGWIQMAKSSCLNAPLLVMSHHLPPSLHWQPTSSRSTPSPIVPAPSGLGRSPCLAPKRHLPNPHPSFGQPTKMTTLPRAPQPRSSATQLMAP